MANDPDEKNQFFRDTVPYHPTESRAHLRFCNTFAGVGAVIGGFVNIGLSILLRDWFDPAVYKSLAGFLSSIRPEIASRLSTLAAHGGPLEYWYVSSLVLFPVGLIVCYFAIWKNYKDTVLFDEKNLRFSWVYFISPVFIIALILFFLYMLFLHDVSLENRRSHQTEYLFYSPFYCFFSILVAFSSAMVPLNIRALIYKTSVWRGNGGRKP